MFEVIEMVGIVVVLVVFPVVRARSLNCPTDSTMECGGDKARDAMTPFVRSRSVWGEMREAMMVMSMEVEIEMAEQNRRNMQRRQCGKEKRMVSLSTVETTKFR
ncbi:hypothetical protein F5Y10DRAFT_14487 [Nemania abortiva]|nr:hypothetical protein F5Y10DRAFT_14487 [Nemania abortiva]